MASDGVRLLEGCVISAGNMATRMTGKRTAQERRDDIDAVRSLGRSIADAARSLRAELAATVKAKQENDERYMIERDAAVQRAETAERERDLALAHDTQPYPTAAAYEAVCAARDAWQAKAERLADWWHTDLAEVALNSGEAGVFRKCAGDLRAALADPPVQAGADEGVNGPLGANPYLAAAAKVLDQLETPVQAGEAPRSGGVIQGCDNEACPECFPPHTAAEEGT